MAKHGGYYRCPSNKEANAVLDDYVDGDRQIYAAFESRALITSIRSITVVL
jgi:hypothetical protein